MKNLLACIFLVFSFTAPAFAEEGIEIGVGVGEKAPPLSVVDIQGKQQTLASLSGEQGLIVVFFRSADWCPFCKRHLVEIKEWVKPLNKKGFNVVGVSYDSTATLKGFTDAKQINFPLLADQNVATIKAYKILNSDYKSSDDNYGIPYPGAVIIDKTGTVRYTYFYEGYKKRVKWETIDAALSSLSESPQPAKPSND